jgi:hypothetical protein
VKINLIKLAQSVENIAFDLASDLTQSAVYSQTTDAKYDAATGKAGTGATGATANVSAMILQFSSKEVDGVNIKKGDERVLIRAVDFGNLKPDQDDEMLGADNIKRQVIAFTLDATKTLYTFQMRTIAS